MSLSCGLDNNLCVTATDGGAKDSVAKSGEGRELLIHLDIKAHVTSDLLAAIAALGGRVENAPSWFTQKPRVGHFWKRYSPDTKLTGGPQHIRSLGSVFHAALLTNGWCAKTYLGSQVFVTESCLPVNRPHENPEKRP
jgi:hypothetical protein